MNKKSLNSMRVLHCPTMVAGNPQGLARAERELGIDSWAIAFQQTHFNYQTDEVLIGPNENQLLLGLKRWQLFWRALRHYDIIHFNFGQSIFPPIFPSTKVYNSNYPSWVKYIHYLYTRILNMNDIAILQKAGKGIVVTFQGDDARQGGYLSNFEISPAQAVDSTYYTAESDRIKQQIISKFANYADRIFYLNPDLAYVLPSNAIFMPYGHIDLRDWVPLSGIPSHNTKPVIVHAPTHRGVKGTNYILEAIERLRAEGVPFEFILVEGLSHKEARTLYGRADLLVDQLLAGWYGGLAVELMALGKPVICYIREEDLKFITTKMREELPVIHATPTTVYGVLRDWLTLYRDKLPELGRRSRSYVEKWHDPLKIGAMLKKEYELILASKRQRTQG